jgi:hypothetical protein
MFAVSLWKFAERHLLSEVKHLPDPEDTLSLTMATMLLDFELAFHAQSIDIERHIDDSSDPFQIAAAQQASTMLPFHRSLLVSVSQDKRWKQGMVEAVLQVVSPRKKWESS